MKELPDVRAAKKTAEKQQDARVSTTDSEALVRVRVMKMPDGGFRPPFNVELATDTESQVVAGFDVINRGTETRTGTGQTYPMLATIKGRAKKTPHG